MSDSVVAHLASIVPADGRRTALLESVLPALLGSIVDVAAALRESHHVALAGGTNAFGDDQLNVDVAAEKIIRTALRACPAVATASSEEDPVEVAVNTPAADATDATETYTIAFDPLDGSSIIAPNWTVGTIVGVWDGVSAVGPDPATAQVASLLGVYGPRTTAVLALRLPGTDGICLDLAYSGTTAGWHVVHPHVQLAPLPVKTRYFAPANLRACVEDARYDALIKQYIADRYTLRYAGGLVPDVVHMLTKQHGLYVSPVTPRSPAKLRRLYEVCPIGLIMECVGGKCVDIESPEFQSVLATPLANTDERGGLIFGTAAEVDKAADALRRS